MLPTAMHSLLGVKRVGFRSLGHWHRDLFDQPHAARFESEPTMMKQRIKLRGRCWLEEVSSNTCKAFYRVELDVRMAAVSHLLEQLFERRVRDSYANLNKLACSYVKTDSYQQFVERHKLQEAANSTVSSPLAETTHHDGTAQDSVSAPPCSAAPSCVEPIRAPHGLQGVALREGEGISDGTPALRESDVIPHGIPPRITTRITTLERLATPINPLSSRSELKSLGVHSNTAITSEYLSPPGAHPGGVGSESGGARGGLGRCASGGNCHMDPADLSMRQCESPQVSSAGGAPSRARGRRGRVADGEVSRAGGVGSAAVRGGADAAYGFQDGVRSSHQHRQRRRKCKQHAFTTRGPLRYGVAESSAGSVRTLPARLPSPKLQLERCEQRCEHPSSPTTSPPLHQPHARICIYNISSIYSMPRPSPTGRAPVRSYRPSHASSLCLSKPTPHISCTTATR